MDIIYKIQPEIESKIAVDELFAQLNKYSILAQDERDELGPVSIKTQLNQARYLLSILNCISRPDM